MLRKIRDSTHIRYRESTQFICKWNLRFRPCPIKLLICVIVIISRGETRVLIQSTCNSDCFIDRDRSHFLKTFSRVWLLYRCLKDNYRKLPNFDSLRALKIRFSSAILVACLLYKNKTRVTFLMLW